jgi:hypothetical protein
MPIAETVMKCGLFLLLVHGMMAVVSGASAGDKEIYEKLGLSETEWNKIQEMKLPLEKVHQLLESGVSISEYYRRPWQELSLSEPEYLRLRRAGHSDADVRSMHARKRIGDGWTAAGSFLLPGVNQIRSGHPVRGWIMAATAAGCVGLFVGWSAASRKFQPLGLGLLFPDMLWSGIDMSAQISTDHQNGPVWGGATGVSAGLQVCFSF